MSCVCLTSVCWTVCECPEAGEGPLLAETHELCAGCETEGLDGFLHWDKRRAAHQGEYKTRTFKNLGMHFVVESNVLHAENPPVTFMWSQNVTGMSSSAANCHFI